MNEQKSEQRTETYRDALPGSAGLVLLFSEPPHAELDLGAVAAALSWALPDARTFFASPLPAVIATFTDEAKAAALARGLETLGVRTAVVAAAELANLPPAIAVTGFAIDEHGLAYAANGGVERRLAWSSVRLGFLVSERRFEVRQSDKDREDQSKGRAKRQQAASPWRSVGTQVDLLREAYDLEQGSKGSHTEMVDTRLELGGLGDDGTPLRLVLARDGLRYEGLGANRQKSAAQNWTVLLELIETRGAIEIDRSADRASPKPVMVGRRGLIDLARHESPAFQRIAAKPAQLHAAFLFWRSGVTAPRKVPAGEVERTPR
ncbi:MAG: hypothetical protein HYV09_03060 [Deltaproteobacteria bacterium]|nr:hypothetical protein [Deltaproteobacteria bacterium]